MKVLVLQSELGMLRGGGENFTNNLFKAFVARGHKVSAVFAADRNKEYAFPLPPRSSPSLWPGGGRWLSDSLHYRRLGIVSHVS